MFKSDLKITDLGSLIAVGAESNELCATGKIDQSHGSVLDLIVISLSQLSIKAGKALYSAAE